MNIEIEKNRGVAVPSRGRYINTGTGPSLHPVDIGHEDYMGLVDPDTAFWSLVRKDSLAETLCDSKYLSAYKRKSAQFADEMNMLRFKLKPSAVYFNATEKCNLDCTYCYIPQNMRRSGIHMSKQQVFSSLRFHPAHELHHPNLGFPKLGSGLQARWLKRLLARGERLDHR